MIGSSKLSRFVAYWGMDGFVIIVLLALIWLLIDLPFGYFCILFWAYFAIFFSTWLIDEIIVRQSKQG